MMVAGTHIFSKSVVLLISFVFIMLFALMSYGLYCGLKVKDNIGILTDHINIKKLPDFSGGMPDISTLLEGVGGGIAEDMTTKNLFETVLAVINNYSIFYNFTEI